MTNDMVLRQVEVVRAITLQKLESITEDVADIMPEGFNNTIRWNVGHILIVQDQLASNFAAFRKICGNWRGCIKVEMSQ